MPAKKKGDETMANLNLRLTPEVLTRADALTAHLAEMRGVAATRSDVVRECIMLGLRALEADKNEALYGTKRRSG